MTQTWLYRAGLFALVILPVAHLTSLGVMEMAGFLALLAGLGLFLVECAADAQMALSRIKSVVALPILGYSIFTMFSALMMLESVDDQLVALRELKWVYTFLHSPLLGDIPPRRGDVICRRSQSDRPDGCLQCCAVPLWSGVPSI